MVGGRAGGCSTIGEAIDVRYDAAMLSKIRVRGIGLK